MYPHYLMCALRAITLLSEYETNSLCILIEPDKRQHIGNNTNLYVHARVCVYVYIL